MFHEGVDSEVHILRILFYQEDLFDARGLREPHLNFDITVSHGSDIVAGFFVVARNSFTFFRLLLFNFYAKPQVLVYFL